ncbi:16S rRNA (adenine(1518)-N(6)/adenine(1519)-N(6))-dimethyltransferase RsmA [Peptococcaceae bacterium]|nr:16S rRNA (adenine(1518)-N(6)/adenine(1519)-N(6))-dimethyltransferase RsmA [Peptococcaceae bacterium]MCL0077746.1 16S rRNA (adenine(1518)-N(6)/adenine(1519)-N(6))-dimethyltransferase RsmA [Peptococcaceae bacterium]MCL0100309.1 16S rRNA (adenine(1518)-N(6)/adenine(1519)-N(6))-dimethyltransferase RsmA [Peptococcaceae bacterium]
MPKLYSISEVKKILNKHNLKANKSLGQNFLVDANIVHKIVDAADILNDDIVVEIGPGLGVLTCALAEKAKKVIAVEIDSKIIPVLKENVEPYENIEIVHADALKINFDALVKEKAFDDKEAFSYKLVANLPYYITSPVVMHMLTNKFNLNTMVIMVQLEVAKRIVAAPGSKDYGILSIAVQYYAEPKIVFKVPKTVFFPKPDVDSAVLELSIRKNPAVDVADESLFFKVIRAAFANRRKKILNSLLCGINLPKELIKKVLGEAGIDETQRGEDLSLDDFAKLADYVLRALSKT